MTRSMPRWPGDGVRAGWGSRGPQVRATLETGAMEARHARA